MNLYLAGTWPILDRYLADTWPILDRCLTDTWPILDRYLTDTWPILNRYLTDTCRPICRPRPPTVHMIPFFYSFYTSLRVIKLYIDNTCLLLFWSRAIFVTVLICPLISLSFTSMFVVNITLELILSKLESQVHQFLIFPLRILYQCLVLWHLVGIDLQPQVYVRV